MAEAAVTFRDLTLGYASHPAIHHLNGEVRRGSLTAIVGANGSGKSTLMKGIAGLLKPMAGVCAVEPGRRVAYLAQRSEIDSSFPARVVDLVSLGLWQRRGLLGRTTPGDWQAIGQAMAAVGLEGFEQRALDTLSGGQMQRALFARVLVQDADLILLDEPFNAIDATTLGDLLEMVRRWHMQGKTVLVVVHDLGLVRRHFPDALLMARRLVAWGPTGQALTAANLDRARDFHEAWDEAAPWCAPSPGHGHGHDHHDHHHGDDGHGHAERPGEKVGAA